MTPECSDEQDALYPQSRKDKKKWLREKNYNPKIILNIEEVEEYCRYCVEWSEVKPVLDMFEALLPLDGPDELRKVIRRIKQVYMGRLYGSKIKTNNIIMKRPYIKGPLNSFKHNKRIDLSK